MRSLKLAIIACFVSGLGGSLPGSILQPAAGDSVRVGECWAAIDAESEKIRAEYPGVYVLKEIGSDRSIHYLGRVNSHLDHMMEPVIHGRTLKVLRKDGSGMDLVVSTNPYKQEPCSTERVWVESDFTDAGLAIMEAKSGKTDR